MATTFRRSLNGYSRKEVDEYIGHLREELDKLRESSEEMSRQIHEQGEEIARYKEQERYIAGTLLDAQNRAVEIEQRAQENYDQSIAQLAEDSKAWEARIQKNKDRLIQLDEMLESFLTSVRDELTVTTGSEKWKNRLEDPEKKLLEEKEEPEQKSEESPVQKEEAPSPEQPAVDPEVDGDIHNLYWRLKHLEEGEEVPRRNVNPAAKKPEEKTEPEKKAEAGQDDIYRPAANEQQRLTSILNELGIYPQTEDEE